MPLATAATAIGKQVVTHAVLVIRAAVGPLGDRSFRGSGEGLRQPLLS